jgi:hypothetical protein
MISSMPFFRFVLCLSILSGARAAAFAGSPSIERIEVSIRDVSQANPSMEFFLRMPANANAGTGPVRVLFLSPFRHDDKNAERFLDSSEWVAFADQHRLALVTANVGKLKTDISNRRTCYYYPEHFSGQAFSRAVRTFQRRHSILSDKDMLFYGVSAGAQWAHRLALLKPKQVLGVACHACSFYDLPKSTDRGPAWLISTGYLDAGSVDASKAFYRRASQLGFPCILKIYPHLGHASSTASSALARTFFETLLAAPVEGDARRVPALFMASPFWGHALSNEIFTKAEIKDFRSDGWFFPLGTRAVADRWLVNR